MGIEEKTYLCRTVVAGGYQEISAVFLVFHIRQEIRMRWNCVNRLATSQIPNLKKRIEDESRIQIEDSFQLTLQELSWLAEAM